VVSRITGMARSTIIRGLAELAVISSDDVGPNRQPRIRRPGGGRKKLTQTDPTLLSDLRALVEPATRGHPQAALLWTSRSLRNLAMRFAPWGIESATTSWPTCCAS
jgi:hypothetical protein